jgi:hypothetical protein
MNTPEQNILSTLKGKKVLFLENGNTLDYGLDELEKICIRSGISYNTLFHLKYRPLDEIKEAINNCSVLIFQTTWVYDIANILEDYIRNLAEVKIVVECYIDEPTWYYSNQHGSKHEVYIYNCLSKESESFYRLSSKPYWEYENGFDK